MINTRMQKSRKKPDTPWDTRLTYADVDAKYQEFF